MSNPVRDLEELQKLVASRGWVLIREAIEREVLLGAMAFGANASMSEKEIDFRRGAIMASSRLLDFPTHLISRLESEVRIKQLTAPATAGKETP
jgi:hypothetical protein